MTFDSWRGLGRGKEGAAVGRGKEAAAGARAGKGWKTTSTGVERRVMEMGAGVAWRATPPTPGRLGPGWQQKQSLLSIPSDSCPLHTHE